MSNILIDTKKCKGIVHQGPRNGQQCQRERSENEYCAQHQRNAVYDQLIADGKTICGGFFRGCNNELSEDDIKDRLKFCSACRLKKSGKQFPCQAKDCKAKILKQEDKYCDKHVRNLLRDNEKEKNIQYCDISRGCFNILTNDIKCADCRNKDKQKAATEMATLRKYYNIILPERTDNDELFEKQELLSFEIKDVWRNMQRGAFLKKNLFTLTQQDFEKLVIQPCYYCGFYSKYKFVGIDRIDNNKGYLINNCVPACSMCNMMKSTNHPNAFLDKINIICSYRQTGTPIYNRDTIKWNQYFTSGKILSYNDYKLNVKLRNKNIQFLLTKSEYESLINGECYLCGIHPMSGHRNGIDRVDSNGDYTVKNSRSCCGHCNMMKRDYSYTDFITKCIQIKAKECDRIIFNQIPVIDPESQKLKNEYYTAEDIAKFLMDGYLTRFLEWCEEKGKSAEFVSAITCIASKLDDNIIDTIKKELENERTRKSNQQKNPEKKHLHCSTIYGWLTGGKEDEFLEWYISSYEKTSLFDKKFKELKEKLISAEKENGIKLCKKFMYDEKSRRNTQKGRDEKRRTIEQYVPSVDIEEVVHEIQYENTLIHTPPPKTIKAPPADEVVQTIVVRQSTEKKDKAVTLPIQWKAEDVYDCIKHNNESTYIQYIKENNTLEDIPEFEAHWNILLQTVKSSTRAQAEPAIKEFILWLRNIRHNKLCAVTNAKKMLEKEDRQHYRTDGLLILFNTKNIDEIAKFKAHTEEYTGDSPDDKKWANRWNEFVTAVEKEPSDENKKKLISNFLAAQRKKKFNRSNRQPDE
jgi:hypothetical protein